jgi:hypothetical protein
MVRLVTQYKPITKERFWDGAEGPYNYHIINTNNKGSSIAMYVGIGGHTTIDPNDWIGDHLTDFQLELIYE